MHMFKNFVIFALGTFAAVKLFGQNKNAANWYYFTILKTENKIIVKKDKSYDGKNKFFYNYDINSSVFYPLK